MAECTGLPEDFGITKITIDGNTYNDLLGNEDRAAPGHRYEQTQSNSLFVGGTDNVGSIGNLKMVIQDCQIDWTGHAWHKAIQVH